MPNLPKKKWRPSVGKPFYFLHFKGEGFPCCEDDVVIIRDDFTPSTIFEHGFNTFRTRTEAHSETRQEADR